MGEKEEKITGAEEETSTLFPPTKKKSGFFSKLFKHEKSKIEEPLENQEKKPITEELPSHQHFRLTNGKTIKNIPQMLEELKTMDDDTFKAHIIEEKNDIANWIKDVFKDPELSEKILQAKKRKKIIKLLEKEIKETEKQFKKEKEQLMKEELSKPLEKPAPPITQSVDPIKEIEEPIKTPKAPKNIEIKLKKPLPNKEETATPPLPPKGFFKKKFSKQENQEPIKQQHFQKSSKKENEEIDKLITLKQEKARLAKKKSLLNNR